MRESEKIEDWVVYEIVQGAQAGMKSVCKLSEWAKIDELHPGMNCVIQQGIKTETEAEKLARGTSGDVPPRKVRSKTPETKSGESDSTRTSTVP